MLNQLFVIDANGTDDYDPALTIEVTGSITNSSSYVNKSVLAATSQLTKNLVEKILEDIGTIDKSTANSGLLVVTINIFIILEFTI